MAGKPGLADLKGEGVLVIPGLERWFLRTTGGLDVVRELIAQVTRSDRKILLGCNAWAWQYFSKSLNVEAACPEPYTFAPFDAERLRQWFRQIARSHDGSTVRFIDPDSGVEILDEQDGGPHKSLVRLAAQSLGIPWVAWHLWRQSLREEQAEEDKSKSEDHQPAPSGTPAVAGVQGQHQLALWVVALE